MKSKKLNKRISALEDEAEQIMVPYFGWYWRPVDWDAVSGTLAVSPSGPPSWFAITLESRVGKPWPGRKVAFCENNKWGYREFRVDGEAWVQLRRFVTNLVKDPHPNLLAALVAYMDTLAPPDSDVSCP